MNIAFVLLKTEPSRERDVYVALTSHAEVVETHALYGEFDLIAMVQAPDQESLTRLLVHDLRLIEGVKETQTMIAVEY